MTQEFLKSTFLAAGDILREGFGKNTGYSTKQDQSNIVTEYDFRAEEVIGLILQPPWELLTMN